MVREVVSLQSRMVVCRGWGIRKKEISCGDRSRLRPTTADCPEFSRGLGGGLLGRDFAMEDFREYKKTKAYKKV